MALVRELKLHAGARRGQFRAEERRRFHVVGRMAGTEGPSTLNDLSLYEEDGATMLTLLIEYPDLETRDMVLATGMTDGMEASYARLEGVLVAS